MASYFQRKFIYKTGKINWTTDCQTLSRHGVCCKEIRDDGEWRIPFAFCKPWWYFEWCWIAEIKYPNTLTSVSHGHPYNSFSQDNPSGDFKSNNRKPELKETEGGGYYCHVQLTVIFNGLHKVRLFVWTLCMHFFYVWCHMSREISLLRKFYFQHILHRKGGSVSVMITKT